MTTAGRQREWPTREETEQVTVGVEGLEEWS
jgi:hypothetical protein